MGTGGVGGTYELPKDILLCRRMDVIEVTDVCARNHAVGNT